MVSSYLICDQCGQYGPPAGFLSHEGLRWCYQCWHAEQLLHDGCAPPDATADMNIVEGRTDSSNACLKQPNTR